ncbi:MocR-like pyridoxine biosynthesis transcription factor PdxR [Flavisphingomonas formosensis]|uniref:MocR-like pyridoxine biosynthesis transcription factor PdxR n=1 Tax=Flavisphingomonas formosensis TaxID=861534 RepID=UPI0012F882D9|nr:PLP-dependent aminotransferase family protein [Sphingomonas formosensis]
MARRPERIMWRQLFALNDDDPRALQIQIRTSVVDAILNGTLKAGTPLPSSRGLAAELSVSRNTVILSYQQLVDDGFLESRERSGFVVAERPASGWVRHVADRTVQPRIDWTGRLRSRASALRNIEKPSDWQSYRYPFVYGQFDPSIFPISDWRQCCRQALSVLELRDWGPDKIDEDDPLLIEQLRTRILPRRGIWAESDEIMVTLGAQQALYLLAEALFDAKTVVGVEEPGYPDMRNIAAMRAAQVAALPIDGTGLVPGPALAACDYAHVTPSHQCPTTVTMTYERRRALLAAAAQSGTVLIEDDYDSETSFEQDPQPALKSLDDQGRVIYVASLSKLLAPGLRLGFIVADAALIRELRALRRLMVRHPPVNNQRSIALFLSFGHYESLVRRLTDAYRRRAHHLVEALTEQLPDLDFAIPTGGSCVWLKGPPGFDARAAALRCREDGLLFEPGDIFFRNHDDGRSHLRLGYSAIPDERIAPGIALLAGAMNRTPALQEL